MTKAPLGSREPLALQGAAILSTGIQVRLMNAEEAAAWDRFVLQHPLGSPFHLTAWQRSVEQVYGYRPLPLVAEQDGEICGVLPLYLIENLLVGKALLSSPFAVYGGALFHDEETRAVIRQKVESLGHELQVQYVELRNGHPEQCLGFSPIDRYVTFTQEIGPDEKQILEAIPRKTRAAVRNSLKKELSTVIRHERSSAFEDLYLNNLRRLGTPSFPVKWFHTLLREFAGQASIHEVMHHNQPVAAVFTLFFRDQVLPYYGASNPQFNSLSPSNFMYYDLMRWAGQNQYRLYDFGRSKTGGSGSYDFKAHWGMVEKPLPYEILLVRRKQLPDFRPVNPMFRWPIAVWRRLPLMVTRVLGPYLVRLVP